MRPPAPARCLQRGACGHGAGGQGQPEGAAIRPAAEVARRGCGVPRSRAPRGLRGGGVVLSPPWPGGERAAAAPGPASASGRGPQPALPRPWLPGEAAGLLRGASLGLRCPDRAARRRPLSSPGGGSRRLRPPGPCPASGGRSPWRGEAVPQLVPLGAGRSAGWASSCPSVWPAQGKKAEKGKVTREKGGLYWRQPVFGARQGLIFTCWHTFQSLSRSCNALLCLFSNFSAAEESKITARVKSVGRL